MFLTMNAIRCTSSTPSSQLQTGRSDAQPCAHSAPPSEPPPPPEQTGDDLPETFINSIYDICAEMTARGLTPAMRRAAYRLMEESNVGDIHYSLRIVVTLPYLGASPCATCTTTAARTADRIRQSVLRALYPAECARSPATMHRGRSATDIHQIHPAHLRRNDRPWPNAGAA